MWSNGLYHISTYKNEDRIDSRYRFVYANNGVHRGDKRLADTKTTSILGRASGTDEVAVGGTVYPFVCRGHQCLCVGDV